MIKDDCIFCKLANGVIPTNKIWEDDTFTVILDANPAAPGHALILPKQHADNIFSAEDDILAKALPLAKKVAAAVKEVTRCDGVNIQQNNGAAAGQTVNHLHIHIIPRFENDGIDLNWPQQSPTAEAQQKMASELAGILRA